MAFFENGIYGNSIPTNYLSSVTFTFLTVWDSRVYLVGTYDHIGQWEPIPDTSKDFNTDNSSLFRLLCSTDAFWPVVSMTPVLAFDWFFFFFFYSKTHSLLDAGKVYV